MRPQKAYIIRISSEISQKYARDAAESCERIGLDYTFVDGVENKTAYDAWTQCNIPVKMLGIYKTHKIDKAACATVSHALVWDRILKNKETAVILEHDAILLQPVTVDIPDNTIVTLGYKLKNPGNYNHIKAGPPTNIKRIAGHEGAHAYAITYNTAKTLLNELNTIGVSLPIDNMFFLNMRKSGVPIAIADPTPAIGWIRESTIWNESSAVNYPFIDSFSRNYNEA